MTQLRLHTYTEINIIDHPTTSGMVDGVFSKSLTPQRLHTYTEMNIIDHSRMVDGVFLTPLKSLNTYTKDIIDHPDSKVVDGVFTPST